jgi:hypothetical protein
VVDLEAKRGRERGGEGGKGGDNSFYGRGCDWFGKKAVIGEGWD